MRGSTSSFKKMGKLKGKFLELTVELSFNGHQVKERGYRYCKQEHTIYEAINV